MGGGGNTATTAIYLRTADLHAAAYGPKCEGLKRNEPPSVDRPDLNKPFGCYSL